VTWRISTTSIIATLKPLFPLPDLSAEYREGDLEGLHRGGRHRAPDQVAGHGPRGPGQLG
jgi:hypothetical protein